MVNVGVNYLYGYDGFEMNESLAYQWSRRAHEAGFVPATAATGESLLNGSGVEKNIAEGMVLTGVAAGQGSKLAACQQGMAFAKGEYGVRVNKKEAIRWLQRCLSDKHCKFNDLNDSWKEEARNTLTELTQQEN